MRRGTRSPTPSRPRPVAARLCRRARRPAHETSTAHLQSAYPFLAGSGLGQRGMYIGRDVYGGAVCVDPWELYAARVIGSPNMLVLGNIGAFKSTLIKTFFWRSYLFGRYGWVLDVKGEYGPLCDAMNGTRIALRPDGDIRLNPLSPLLGAAQQDSLLQAVAATALGRALEPQEATGLTAALDVLRHTTNEPILPDVAELLLRPTAEMAERLVTAVEDLGRDVRTVALALVALCQGELRGMFDGPTSRAVDWGARMIVLDLSHVADSRALGILMACATAAIQAHVAARHRRAELAQQPSPKTFGVVEEGALVLREEQIAADLQARYKLARKWGESNVLVCHHLRDAHTTGADGSRAVQLVEGLFADTDIRVIYRQPPDQVDYTRTQLGLTAAEAEMLPDLAPGVALWHVGRYRAVVQHRISAIERELVETDHNMRLRAEG